jgi:hypothetical protein
MTSTARAAGVELSSHGRIDQGRIGVSIEPGAIGRDGDQLPALSVLFKYGAAHRRPSTVSVFGMYSHPIQPA